MRLHGSCLKINLIVAVAILASMSLSCSHGSGNSSPLLPPVNNDEPFRLNVTQPQSGVGHHVIGFGSVYFDPVAGTVEAIPDRTPEAHVPLTNLMNKCPGGCLQWKVTGHDSGLGLWYIDVKLINPTKFEAYDVRVIITDLPGDPAQNNEWRVDNPDSYTNDYDDDPVVWDKEELDTWLNPFIAFEKEDFIRKFLPDPTGPAVYFDTEPLRLYQPPGAPGGKVDYIVEGCYPGHCYEPYQILNMWQSKPLPPEQPTSSVYFEAIVADWGPTMDPIEPDISDVSIWIPDIIDDDVDNELKMHEWPTTGPNKWPPSIDASDGLDQNELNFYIAYKQFAKNEGSTIVFPTLRKYWCNVLNDKMKALGFYHAVVYAKSDDIDGQGFDTMYNHFWFEVNKSGTGGDPTKHPMIVFTSYKNGNADLYYYMLETSAIGLLSADFTSPGNMHSDELEPSLHNSPTKTQVAFSSNWNNDVSGGLDDFELYTADITFSGGVPVLLNHATDWDRKTNNSSDDVSPDWSPNGVKIAYSAYQTGQFDIYTLDTSLPGAPFRVTVSFADDEAPAYDKSKALGTWMFYQSNRAGGGNYEVYAIDPTQKESSFNLPTRITFSAGFDGYPGSSPTGDFAFSTERWGPADIVRAHYDGSTWVYYRLSENPGEPEQNNANDLFPSFSPDGQWIAFSSDRVNDQFEIFKMAFDGSALTRLTFFEEPDLDPSYGGLP
jgi:Tol biopolymer transport system component